MTPIRTCVGCGTRAAQADLLRFVAVRGGALAVNRGRREQGRGAYLHDDRACWAAFERRRGPIRSLRTTPSRTAREELIRTLAADMVQQ